MIKARSRPRDLAQGFLAEPMDNMWQDWMRQVDQVLDDEQLVDLVYEALVRRHPRSRTRGDWVRPRKSSCACWCSSICVTGAFRFWSGKCGPIWCTANLPGWVETRCPTPRRWDDKPWLWGRRSYRKFITAWWASRARSRSPLAANCAWTRR